MEVSCSNVIAKGERSHLVRDITLWHWLTCTRTNLSCYKPVISIDTIVSIQLCHSIRSLLVALTHLYVYKPVMLMKCPVGMSLPFSSKSTTMSCRDITDLRHSTKSCTCGRKFKRGADPMERGCRHFIDLQEKTFLPNWRRRL